MKKNVMFVDPPQGWLYSFPKELTQREDQTFSDWLRENNYPEDLIDIACSYSRFWLKEVEEEK